MTPPRSRWILVVLAVIAFGVLVLSQSGILHLTDNTQPSYLTYNSSLGKIVVRTVIPTEPVEIPRYRVNPLDTDMIELRVSNLMAFRENVTSESDAPVVAERQLSGYGGLPEDAVLVYSKTINAEQSSGITTKKYPIMTEVQYTRRIDGIPVLGRGGLLRLSFGENDEVLELYKVWRTVNRSGTVNIIPAKTALTKLTRGEILGDRIKCQCDLNIDSIQPGYYEKGFNETQELIEPVWIFSGSTSQGDFLRYSVYARQFANFSSTPFSLNVQFTDTSDASPVKWAWNFGDDTESTLQNPEHTYQNAGTYNVTLTAWNDLGSDIITKQVPVLR